MNIRLISETKLKRYQQRHRGLAQCHQPFSADQQPPLLQAGHRAPQDKPEGDHEH